jgi:glutaredoxin
MNRLGAVVLGVLLAVSGTAGAATSGYRWVDAEGKVHYSDKEPPASARKTEEKKFGSPTPVTTKGSYAAQLAAQKHPVTLYNTTCGDSCKNAADLLAKRGIPATTRDARDATVQAEMTKLIGGLEVPVLVVGTSAPLKGFDPEVWGALLDAAGYPKSGTAPRKAE